MELPLPKFLKDLWEIWEIRGCILFSMFLQCFLILSAPLRKRVSSIWMYMSIWSAYLLADWVASFTIGQISNNRNDKSCASEKGSNPDIFAFWASFLLVHLGGPDTISAFALEDNELWRRHMLTLVFQSLSALYVFYQTLPNRFWMPTIFVFVSGVIKYGERIFALFLASLDTFRDNILRKPDPGPNYAKLMNEYHSMKEGNLPTSIREFRAPAERKSVNQVRKYRLSPTEVVLHAHYFFEMFKGLIVDSILGFRERDACREYFLERDDEDAFNVIEAELNLIYDVLFTKVPVVYNRWGYSFRFLCSSLVITSLGLFYFQQKSNFSSYDVSITYTLLFGAISLDIIAFVMLIVSDWVIVKTHQLPPVNNIDNAEAASGNPVRNFFSKLVHRFVRRWSESVSSYNLIYYSRHTRNEILQKFYDILGLTNFLDGLWYVEGKPFTNELRKHIFGELKLKSDMAVDLETAKALTAVKGDWTLQENNCPELLRYVQDVDYDQSLLLWHIATDLCYHNEEVSPEGIDENKNYRELSKLLSDYMLYLLVMQPTMMSAVAGIGQIRFRDTCADAKKFFYSDSRSERNKKPKWVLYLGAILRLLCTCVASLFSPLMPFVASLYLMLFLPLVSVLVRAVGRIGMQEKVENHYSSVMDYYSYKRKEEEKKAHANFCKKILAVPTEVEPLKLKGEKSKSVFFDGCILAKKLKDLDGEVKNKWEIMSKVWVEMLSYAAINCRARTHAQELAKGGQLLTVVWLLMVQFGFGTQFQIKEGDDRAKLHVGK